MRKLVFPISIGIMWGIVFGSALHNWPLGICVGVLMGMLFRNIGDSDKYKVVQEDKTETEESET